MDRSPLPGQDMLDGPMRLDGAHVHGRDVLVLVILSGGAGVRVRLNGGEDRPGGGLDP